MVDVCCLCNRGKESKIVFVLGAGHYMFTSIYKGSREARLALCGLKKEDLAKSFVGQRVLQIYKVGIWLKSSFWGVERSNCDHSEFRGAQLCKRGTLFLLALTKAHPLISLFQKKLQECDISYMKNKFI